MCRPGAADGQGAVDGRERESELPRYVAAG